MPARPSNPTDALAVWPCLTVHGQSLWLAVSVSPNARRTATDGLHDGALRVRLVAPPVDGKANELLIEWIAGQLGLPRRAVTLARGQSARRKWLAIDAPTAVVAGWLAVQAPADATVKAGTSPKPSPPAR